MTREGKELFASYINKFTEKRREVVNALGHVPMTCTQCSHRFTVANDFPDTFWSYLLMRGAKLSEQHKQYINNWHPEKKRSLAKCQELLLTLDRTEQHVIAAQVASAKKSSNHLCLPVEKTAQSSTTETRALVSTPEVFLVEEDVPSLILSLIHI